MYNDDDCSICLDYITKSIKGECIMKCSHRIHSLCLQDLLDSNLKQLCPICRKPIARLLCACTSFCTNIGSPCVERGQRFVHFQHLTKQPNAIDVFPVLGKCVRMRGCDMR